MTVIDRFENNIAVLESDGVMIEIDRLQLADDAHEGDVVIESGGRWLVDVAATEKRRSDIREMMKRLIKK